MWKARLAVVILALGIGPGAALAEPVATAQKRLDDWRAYRVALPWLHQQFNKSQLDEIERSNIRMFEDAKAAVEEEKRQRAAAAKAVRKPQEDALKERERKFFECIWHPDRLIGLTRDQLRGKCGYWDKVNRTTTASGVREQIVYSMVSGPRFYVYTENGIVTAVQN